MILISSDGIIIRIRAESIRQCQRPSKGVLLMRLSEDGRVVTVASTAHDEGEDSDEPLDDGCADDGADGAEEEETGDETPDGE